MSTQDCPICASKPRGPLCKDHRHKLASTIHELRLAMETLKRVERREERIESRQGGARSAFPAAAINISAADLYDDTEDIIQDVAADIGLWGGKASILLRKLASRIGRLYDAPNSGRDYRDLTDALQKVRERITPQDERVIYGRCLNPVCKAQLVGLPGVSMVTCSQCESTWSVAAVQDARVEGLKGQMITCTPKAAGEWLEWKTGQKVTRKRVGMWIQRGKLPSVKAARQKGEWVFDTGELLACL